MKHFSVHILNITIQLHISCKNSMKRSFHYKLLFPSCIFAYTLGFSHQKKTITENAARPFPCLECKFPRTAIKYIANLANLPRTKLITEVLKNRTTFSPC